MAIIQKTENDSLTAGDRRAIDRFIELGETDQLFDGNITIYRVYRKHGEIRIRKALTEDWHDCQALYREAGTGIAHII